LQAILLSVSPVDPSDLRREESYKVQRWYKCTFLLHAARVVVLVFAGLGVTGTASGTCTVLTTTIGRLQPYVLQD